METISKYINFVILISTLTAVVYGAVSWFPNNFMTKDEFVQYEAKVLDRDKQLERLMRWNYLESQIRLNMLIIRNYREQDLAGTLSDDDRLRWKALEDGQVELIKERNDFSAGGLDWAN